MKSREECQPFTYTIYPTVDVAAPTPYGLSDMRRRVERNEKAKEKVSKAIERELNRKRKAKYPPDNLAAFLEIRFPKAGR